jgi:hypothetical protein
LVAVGLAVGVEQEERDDETINRSVSKCLRMGNIIPQQKRYIYCTKIYQVNPSFLVSLLFLGLEIEVGLSQLQGTVVPGEEKSCREY